jgi:peptide/nickel transport system substrate-binding protein
MKNTVHLLLMVLLIALLAACKTATEVEITPTASDAATTVAAEVESTQAVEPTGTPVPERVVVACLGNEPETLFLYGGASSAMWTVLEAIYDGPFDRIDGVLQPVILKEVPTVENGGITFNLVDTFEGQLVVDAKGNHTVLTAGTIIMPAGCTNLSCAVEWQPDAGIDMDMMSVEFELDSGLTW